MIFAAQPWSDGSNLDDFLSAVASDSANGPVKLQAVVAWAKRSGLSRIRPYLSTIRGSGGSVELIVGISEGGATRQGLELAMELCDRAEVFHDPGRTFHPKVYLAQSPSATRLFVGSNNLTHGGLAHNYEAGLSLRVGTADSNVHDVLIGSVVDWIERLRAEAPNCKTLTPKLLQSLLEDPRYRIGDEDSAPRLVAEDGTVEDTDSPTDQDESDQGSIFAPSSSIKKASRHNASGRRATKRIAQKASSPDDGDRERGETVVPPRGRVEFRWSKRLKSADAQQVAFGTSPTGALRLSQSGHAIEKETYFRDVFFGQGAWVPDPVKPGLEYTEVPIDVTIHGKHLGPMLFRVDHKLSRAAEQGNVTTVLKWGPMNAILRNQSYIDDWVLLERFADGYRLEITSSDPRTT